MSQINNLNELNKGSSKMKKSVKSFNPKIRDSDRSYDIIKAHGGQIKVETKVDEGTELIIQLPFV